MTVGGRWRGEQPGAGRSARGGFHLGPYPRLGRVPFLNHRHGRFGSSLTPPARASQTASEVKYRLDHLMPLVRKFDKIEETVHAIDKSMIEIKSDLRHVSADVAEIKTEGERCKSNFWPMLSAVISGIVAIFVVLQFLFSHMTPAYQPDNSRHEQSTK